MAKAKREINDKIKLIDIVIELVDARAPYASKNPMFDGIINQKPRLIVMTKKDLADPLMSQQWLNFYQAKGYYAMLVNLKNFNEYQQIISMCKDILKRKNGARTQKRFKTKSNESNGFRYS